MFRSLRTSTVAAQADWDQAPLTIDVMPAPEFVSVLWKNLSIGLFERFGHVIQRYLKLIASIQFRCRVPKSNDVANGAW